MQKNKDVFYVLKLLDFYYYAHKSIKPQIIY